MSLEELTPTLRGTASLTECSIIFRISSVTRSTVARSSGHVNQTPLWKEEHICDQGNKAAAFRDHHSSKDTDKGTDKLIAVVMTVSIIA